MSTSCEFLNNKLTSFYATPETRIHSLIIIQTKCVVDLTHPSLIQKKFIKNYHQNGQWGMIKGSCGSSKLVLPNSGLLLFERKFSSKFKTAVTFLLLPKSIIGNPYYFLIGYQLPKKCYIFNNLRDTAHQKSSSFAILRFFYLPEY